MIKNKSPGWLLEWIFRTTHESSTITDLIINSKVIKEIKPYQKNYPEQKTYLTIKLLNDALSKFYQPGFGYTIYVHESKVLGLLELLYFTTQNQNTLDFYIDLGIRIASHNEEVHRDIIIISKDYEEELRFMTNYIF